jgi:hypothetical protein
MLAFVSTVAPALRKLEDQIGRILDEHRDAIARQVAIALVQLVAEERARANGTPLPGPRLCARCRVRLAARARTVCDSCRGRERRERERLRDAHAAELRAAATGARGPRGREVVLG